MRQNSFKKHPRSYFSVHEIESYVQIKGAPLTDLSAQQITSCTPNTLKCGGTGGCQGSIPQLAYSYVQLFGLVADKDYEVIFAYHLFWKHQLWPS